MSQVEQLQCHNSCVRACVDSVDDVDDVDDVCDVHDVDVCDVDEFRKEYVDDVCDVDEGDTDDVEDIYIYLNDVAVDDVGDGKDRTDVGHANDACDVDEVHVDDVFGNSSFWKKHIRVSCRETRFELPFSCCLFRQLGQTSTVYDGMPDGYMMQLQWEVVSGRFHA